jgi:hypothetical protein
MWPTPMASEGRQGWQDRSRGKAGTEESLSTVILKGEGRTTDQDPTAGGQLNPTWVEWLMGFPLGWTDCEHLATPSFRKSLKSSDAG